MGLEEVTWNDEVQKVTDSTDRPYYRTSEIVRMSKRGYLSDPRKCRAYLKGEILRNNVEKYDAEGVEFISLTAKEFKEEANAKYICFASFILYLREKV